MKTRAFTFFDLDNTLYKGKYCHVIFDFPYYLNSKGLFSIDSIRILDDLRNRYDAGKIDRETYTLSVVKSYYAELKDIHVSRIERIAIEYWQDFNSSAWFPYALDLVKLLSNHTDTIMVSGSPFEVIKIIYKKIGIKELFATSGITQNDRYIGKFDELHEMATAKAKRRFIEDLNKRDPYDPSKSFAFGDSESDFPLFMAVNHRNAYLISQKETLLQYGKQMGWNTVSHNDDIVALVQDRISEIYSNDEHMQQSSDK